MAGKGSYAAVMLMFVMAMALFANHAFADNFDDMDAAYCLMTCSNKCDTDTKCLESCGISCISPDHDQLTSCKLTCSLKRCVDIVSGSTFTSIFMKILTLILLPPRSILASTGLCMYV